MGVFTGAEQPLNKMGTSNTNIPLQFKRSNLLDFCNTTSLVTNKLQTDFALKNLILDLIIIFIKLCQLSNSALIQIERKEISFMSDFKYCFKFLKWSEARYCVIRSTYYHNNRFSIGKISYA